MTYLEKALSLIESINQNKQDAVLNEIYDLILSEVVFSEVDPEDSTEIICEIDCSKLNTTNVGSLTVDDETVVKDIHEDVDDNTSDFVYWRLRYVDKIPSCPESEEILLRHVNFSLQNLALLALNEMSFRLVNFIRFDDAETMFDKSGITISEKIGVKFSYEANFEDFAVEIFNDDLFAHGTAIKVTIHNLMRMSNKLTLFDCLDSTSCHPSGNALYKFIIHECIVDVQASVSEKSENTDACVNASSAIILCKILDQVARCIVSDCLSK